VARSRAKQGNRKHRVRLKEVYESTPGVFRTRLARDGNGKVKTVGIASPPMITAPRRWKTEREIWNKVRDDREAAERLRQQAKAEVQ